MQVLAWGGGHLPIGRPPKLPTSPWTSQGVTVAGARPNLFWEPRGCRQAPPWPGSWAMGMGTILATGCFCQDFIFYINIE